MVKMVKILYGKKRKNRTEFYKYDRLDKNNE